MKLPKLRTWRELRGYTQRELAARAGVSPRSVAAYEAGANALPRSARQIAEVLDLDITVLAGVEEPTARPKGDAPEYLSHLSEEDRRIIMGLDKVCDRLDARIRTGAVTPDAIEDATAYNEAIAALLTRAMRAEAEALHEKYPLARDLQQWAIVGAKVERYIGLVMQIIDAGDDLDRKRVEVYKTAS